MIANIIGIGGINAGITWFLYRCWEVRNPWTHEH